MIRRCSILALLLGTFIPSLAQWSQLGSGMANGGVRAMDYDPASGRLYAFGSFEFAGDSLANGTAFWDGTRWHSMGLGITNHFTSVVESVVFNDSVLISGFFQTMVGIPGTRGTALWNGSEWRSIGGNGTTGIAWGMLHNEDGVTIVGSMDSVAGLWTNGIARYTNGAWQNLCVAPVHPGIVSFTSVAKYQDQYIVGGNVNINDLNEIGYLDGDTLRQLGPGIAGDSWVNDMAVFQGKLYVAGEFYAGSGNAASCLMAWDGTSWSDPFPGTGVQCTAQALEVEVINDELFVCMKVRLPGSTDYYGLARFDGEQLCLFGKNLNTAFLAIAGNEDELYVAPNMRTLGVDGEDVHYIARYDLSHPSDTCLQIGTGLLEYAHNEGNWSLGPNPCSDRVMLSTALGTRGPIEFVLCDALGRVVLRKTLPALGDGVSTHVGLEGIGSGPYFVRIHGPDGRTLHVGKLLVRSN